MANYFTIDLKKKRVISKEGDEYTGNQFRKIVERNAEKGVFFDMTLTTQRFLRNGYDWSQLFTDYDDMERSGSWSNLRFKHAKCAYCKRRLVIDFETEEHLCCPPEVKEQFYGRQPIAR